MSNEHDEPGHGDSPAAWTTVVVSLIGLAIGTAAFYINYTYDVDLLWLVWVGAAIMVIGLIIGIVMRSMGYGVGGHRSASKTTA